MKAIWNEQVIAESDDTVVVEGNHYFPRESLQDEFIRDSEHSSHCPWKGTANYYHLDISGATNANAVWYYAEPYAKAGHIRDRVAFWHGVRVEE
jgi:uncharacterized protein (DUF427 family)